MSSKWVRALAWLFGTLCVIALTCWVAFNLLLSSLVDTRLLQREPHASKPLDAVLVSKDAGATSTTAYQVSVTGRNRSPNEENTVLIVDQLPSNPKLAWRGDELRILLPSPERTFRKLEKIRVNGRDVTVGYDLAPPHGTSP